MALDREKTFSNAERLLKQGKVAQALDECRRLADDAPKDLLMLNRLGDLLARSNRGVDAIVYYDKIAEQFSSSGFYPKAIAILKKIVKVDPNNLTAVVRLGELNLKQKLPGEARTWLLQAAEAYVRQRDFAKARDVYEKLVAAEPDNMVHVVRLAEARAAEGDSGKAGVELIALGTRMLAASRGDDAVRAFKRAAEMMPDRAEPIVGLARCEAAAGHRDEALRLAAEAWAGGEGAGSAAGELLQLFENLGASDRSEALLLDPKSDEIKDEALEPVFRAALAAGTIDDLWERVTPLFDRRTRAREFDRAAKTLERLGRIEDGGHVAALERLVELRKAEGNRGPTARAAERLIRACQAKGLTDKTTSALATLKLFDPTSPLLFLGGVAADPQTPRPASSPRMDDSPVAAAFEAPGVPISTADQEFVNGNLTEAEVFEKYGLHREALQQLRQITTRFPGHVIAQEKLVGFLRTQADRGALRDGLVALAFAKRASGDTEGAQRAAREAAASGGIESSIRGALVKFNLLAASDTPAPPAAPKPPAPPPPAASSRTPAAATANDDELEIVFDDGAPTSTSGSAPLTETLEEIEFYLGQGMEQDALTRIAQARAAGMQGATLDALEARARTATPMEPFAEPVAGPIENDEEDLSSITAALEAEYGTDLADDGESTPLEPESEQSMDQVFESFREHVKEAVDVGDFRTHYDLAIAYKEMGLLDDAVSEFKIASGAPELYRDACIMLGLCQWERGETEESIRWYRAALDAPGSEEVRLSALRYDLAERLEQTGDDRGAHDLFALVVNEEPGYRDAGRRVAALRAKLGL